MIQRWIMYMSMGMYFICIVACVLLEADMTGVPDDLSRRSARCAMDGRAALEQATILGLFQSPSYWWLRNGPPRAPPISIMSCIASFISCVTPPKSGCRRSGCGEVVGPPPGYELAPPAAGGLGGALPGLARAVHRVYYGEDATSQVHG